jgi:flagellar operon protein
MNKIGGQFASIEQITSQYFSAEPVNKKNTDSDISFDDILRQKTEGTQTDLTLKFSKHASSRLESRNISLTDTQNARLQQGMEQASKKGIQDSLILVDSLAFIVNVPNRTVVTAMDQTETTDNNVFTNIDGAVIA